MPVDCSSVCWNYALIPPQRFRGDPVNCSCAPYTHSLSCSLTLLLSLPCPQVSHMERGFKNVINLSMSDVKTIYFFLFLNRTVRHVQGQGCFLWKRHIGIPGSSCLPGHFYNDDSFCFVLSLQIVWCKKTKGRKLFRQMPQTNTKA